MKLVTFTDNKQSRVGAVVDGSLVNDTVVDSEGQADIPTTMIQFLEAGPGALVAMQKQIDSGKARIALNDVKLQAPVPRPGKYLAISLNLCRPHCRNR